MLVRGRIGALTKARAQRAAGRQVQARPVAEPTYTGREIAPIEGLHDSGQPAEWVRTAWHAQKRAELATAAAVRAARAEGLSWHQVGLLVHMTAEGARRRWGVTS